MKKARSPNYPAIDLETAVDLATKLERYAKRHSVPATSVMEKAWELKAASSYGFQCIAALKQFGLVEDEGTGDKRHVRLTEDGAKIVHEHSDRPRLLREAAAKPRVHANILKAHGTSEGLPPDETLRSYLLFDHDPPFNSSSVDGFLRQFRNTMRFSGLVLSGDISDNRAIDEPENRLDLNERHDNEFREPPKKPGMKQEVFTLHEGDVVIRWPERLSPESLEDFEDWWKIMLRKVKRAATVRKDEPSSDDAEIE